MHPGLHIDYTLSHPSTTVTSARIPDKDACHRARNLCVFSRIQKGTPGLTHKGCVLQRISLGRRHGRSRDEIKYNVSAEL